MTPDRELPVDLDACNRDDARALFTAFMDEWSRHPDWSGVSVMQNALTVVFMNRSVQ